ncbi:mitotic fidelity of chromosome transmission- protein, partial [Linderina macrospora]
YSNGEVYANSGVLSVPVGGAKPMRQSFERTMFYLVTSGKVEVTIRGSVMQIGILGQFVIPSGNSYGIKNVGTHPAQLYFVQVSVNDVTGPPLPKALQHGGQEQDRQEQSDEEEDEEEDEEKDEGNDEDEDEDEDVVDEDMAGMDHLSDISEEL